MKFKSNVVGFGGNNAVLDMVVEVVVVVVVF